MSKRFNPLSTAVAVATASLIVAVTGCASSRTSDESLAMSRDVDTTPVTAGQATPTNPLDATNQPNAMDSTTVAMPAEPTAPIPPVAINDTQPAQPISEATPAAPVTDVSAAQPMPAQTPPSTPAYTSSTDTTTSSTTTTDMSTSSSDPALPPRQDRH